MADTGGLRHPLMFTLLLFGEDYWGSDTLGQRRVWGATLLPGTTYITPFRKGREKEMKRGRKREREREREKIIDNQIDD